MFEHASKMAAQGQFDYATNLLTDCVTGDPGNVIYCRAFLDNLFKKYNNNKKGSKLASMAIGVQGSIKKASMSKDWPGLIKAGLEMLKLNPWHLATLTQMAAACEELRVDECQLAYLKAALDFNGKDPEINRLCGRALACMGHFDQAISCWHRVEQAKGGDEEAMRAIADLSEPFEKSETVLPSALHASGSSLDIRERLEDTQLRRGRAQLAIAEQRAASEATIEAAELAKKMRHELNRLETDVYRSRAERYPTNLELKYELGLRLKRGGQFVEAIQFFQLARADSKLAADVYLELGECFYHIKQYKLALSSYGTAVESSPERDVEKRKLALYRCGTLAYVMKDLDLAEKHLTDVAGLDPDFKDVAKWLDKIAQTRTSESGDSDD
jgi:tetratricopeptide (TPR) repeat protein